jgi:hypothetical protein
MVECVGCVAFLVISFRSHPVMALPKFDATLDTWIASPVALPRVVNCAREREILGPGDTGLTCNISTDENALSTSIKLKAKRPNAEDGEGLALGNAEGQNVEQQA